MQKIPQSTWTPVLAGALPSHWLPLASPAHIAQHTALACLEHTWRHQNSTAWPSRITGLNWTGVLLQPRKASAEWLTALALRHGPALGKTKERVYSNAPRIRSSPSQSVRKGSVPYSQESRMWTCEFLKKPDIQSCSYSSFQQLLNQTWGFSVFS